MYYFSTTFSQLPIQGRSYTAGNQEKKAYMYEHSRQLFFYFVSLLNFVYMIFVAVFYILNYGNSCLFFGEKVSNFEQK